MRDEEKKGSYKVRETVLKILVKAEKNNSYVNLVVNAYLPGLASPRDRAVAAAIAYGTVQRLNTLDWALSCYLKKPLQGLTPWIRNLLRSAAYQLLYMQNMPSALAVDVAVRLSYRYGHRGVASLVNAVLRKVSAGIDALPWPDQENAPASFISLYHSHPSWLVERWIGRMGKEEAARLCEANNHSLPVSLRVNPLKAGVLETKERLEREGVEVERGSLPVSLKVRSRASPGELESFKQGLYTVQGESSMHCAYILSPAPGEEVIDLCSAPGGKATHLAELMKDRGVVYAGDINASRAGLVEKSSSRLGINIIRTRVWDGREVSRYVSSSDAVLCDAPCTGLGVIPLKPDLKWYKQEEDLVNLPALQGELLQAAGGVVKPGGKLLYAVCSLEPEETTGVVENFLKNNPGFSPLEAPSLPFYLRGDTSQPGTVIFYPHLHRKEGFFMALFRRDI